MTVDSDTRVDRLASADVLSAKAVAIGIENGVAISKCAWDIGADFGHEYAHRLDLSTETNTVRIYFSDLELTTSDNEPRKNRTEDRLQRAVVQLIVRAPQATYTYR